MVTAHVELTPDAADELQVIAQRTGKTLDELVREAVEQYVAQFHRNDRLPLLQQARGMWGNRQDLPAVEGLRGEMDRM